MHDDFSGIKPETLKECIHASEVWENTANAEWPVTEGPTVVKIKNTYYLFYSANDFRNPDYAMGYATSESPMGPWKKQSQPLLSKQRFGINGTGHGDLLKQGDQWYYVFHTHHSNLKPTPRKTVIIKMRFTGTSWEPLVESFRFLIDVKP